MTDVVVTVPKQQWRDWLAEGDLAGDGWTGREYGFTVPFWANIEPGERVYVVAHGRLRGYAPLIRVDWCGFDKRNRWALVRGPGAVAVTIPASIKGFQGFRYRWWDRSEEFPFPAWRDV